MPLWSPSGEQAAAASCSKSSSNGSSPPGLAQPQYGLLQAVFRRHSAAPDASRQQAAKQALHQPATRVQLPAAPTAVPPPPPLCTAHACMHATTALVLQDQCTCGEGRLGHFGKQLHMHAAGARHMQQAAAASATASVSTHEAACRHPGRHTTYTTRRRLFIHPPGARACMAAAYTLAVSGALLASLFATHTPTQPVGGRHAPNLRDALSSAAASSTWASSSSSPPVCLLACSRRRSMPHPPSCRAGRARPPLLCAGGFGLRRCLCGAQPGGAACCCSLATFAQQLSAARPSAAWHDTQSVRIVMPKQSCTRWTRSTHHQFAGARGRGVCMSGRLCAPACVACLPAARGCLDAAFALRHTPPQHQGAHTRASPRSPGWSLPASQPDSVGDFNQVPASEATNNGVANFTLLRTVSLLHGACIGAERTQSEAVDICGCVCVCCVGLLPCKTRRVRIIPAAATC